ncbi:succinate-semialdehyde dehydrogenase [Aureococcus anophagefferens]|nr:succinate-semialdehyde dehydrogenase [Aureococcus anophagefferens]
MRHATSMQSAFQRCTKTIRCTNALKNALTRCASTSSALADLRVVDAANEASALVGGAWVRTARTFAVVDPGSGAPICDVADCGPEQARAAVDAAAAALPAWAGTTARERSDALREWHRRILAASEDIATLMTAECGKPLAEARGEVAYGASSFVEWFAEEAPRVAGEVKANAGSDRRLLTVRQPVGVCAAITPWNFPVAMITRKVAPAVAAGAGKERANFRKAPTSVAAGCPVVVKPSEDTPLSALALARLADGLFPAGVLNVLASSRDHAEPVGAALCDAPEVRALSFTGSTAVGKWLYRRCAETVKVLSLELGGNAPFLVLESADVDVAADAAMTTKFRNAGQTCVCADRRGPRILDPTSTCASSNGADRFLVHASKVDAFVDALERRIAALPVGHGFDDGTMIGPLINPAAAAKVDARVRASGGRTLVGGAWPLPGLRDAFYPPTIVADVPLDSALWVDETFGPVVPLRTFETDAEAVALANDGPAGLAAYCCGDLAHAWAVAERLEFGIVGVNEGGVSDPAMPFGGVKESGLGREGGAHGIDMYLEDKYLCLGGMRF